MIEVQNISFSYHNKRVLSQVSFKIKPGERVVLLGSNGSGKTTLLKILNGLLFPDEGEYRYKGERITKKKLKNGAFSRTFRHLNVMLFQSPEVMLFNLTVYDEIAFGLRQIGYREEEVREKVYLWAEVLEVERYLKAPPFELSGGEKQKVMLAALLALQPETLLLDEPMANLDPRSQGRVIDLLWELPITTIISTNHLGQAGELGNRALLLSEDHTLLYDGEIDALLESEGLLIKANLIHRHKHRHKKFIHTHYHKHG